MSKGGWREGGSGGEEDGGWEERRRAREEKVEERFRFPLSFWIPTANNPFFPLSLPFRSPIRVDPRRRRRVHGIESSTESEQTKRVSELAPFPLPVRREPLLLVELTLLCLFLCMNRIQLLSLPWPLPLHLPPLNLVVGLTRTTNLDLPPTTVRPPPPPPIVPPPPREDPLPLQHPTTPPPQQPTILHLGGTGNPTTLPLQLSLLVQRSTTNLP